MLILNFKKLTARITCLVLCCLVGATTSIPTHATQPYLEDADLSIPPDVNPRAVDISEHLWPRIMMAETQTLAGDREQYSKYRAIAASAHSIVRIVPMQSENPDLQYYRTITPFVYLGYNNEDSGRLCPQGHGNPFSRTTLSTEDCGVYAGHWLYQGGALSTNSLSSTSTTLRVEDISRFSNGQYVVIYDAPAGSFNNAEHARITSLNNSTNTLTIERGFKSNAVAHPRGSIVAQHMLGFGNSNPLNWSYNLSTQSPRDANNRTYNQFLPIWIQENISRDLDGDPTDAKVTGILFDADFNFLFRSGNADVNNDLAIDHGVSPSGINWWGDGMDDFYARVRDRFPDFIVIGGVRDSRGFESLNGTQFEGFPGHTDFFSPDPEYNNLASLLSNYRFNIRHRSNGPAHTHILSKTPSSLYPSNLNPSLVTNRTFRFALGLTLLEDGYFGFRNNTVHTDMWFDEYAVDITRGSPNFGNAITSTPDDEAKTRAHLGWLGQPLGPRTRIYSDAEFAPQQAILSATFDNNINDWSGQQVSISRTTSSVKDGAGALRASGHLNGYKERFGSAIIRGPLVNVIRNQEYTYVFSARATQMREISITIGGHQERFILSPEWQRFVVTFRAEQTDTSRARFNVGRESSEVFVDSVYLFEGNANVFRRDFDNGIVVVNATPSTRTVSLGGTFHRINGQQDSTNNGATLSSVTLPPHESAILIRRENDLPNTDVQEPWVNIIAPTKMRAGPINDTRIVVNDQLRINANDVRLGPDNTAGVSNFDCDQINVRQVNCSMTIDRSGDLRIRATDAQGNINTESEIEYQVTGGTTGDRSIPMITINAPTKTNNGLIDDTTITVIDDTQIRATDIAIRDNSTVGVENFNCSQTSNRQVNCTLRILSSGDLRVIATDAAGNIHRVGEDGYVINDGTSTPGGGNTNQMDTNRPFITFNAPTKTSTRTISNTVITINDDIAIIPAGVELRPGSTAETQNFSCQQQGETSVSCTLDILSSGEIRIAASDVAGNTRFRTEADYEITQVSDTDRPFITISAPTKSSTRTISNTVITIEDDSAVNPAGIELRPGSTAETENFRCQQQGANIVTCTLDIISSGEIRIAASDAAGNTRYRTEANYEINGATDSTKPFIVINAPTKISSRAITDTSFIARDRVGINVSDVQVRNNTTAGISNLNCQQTDFTTVSCSLNITSSGDLLLTAKDRAGNVTYRAETDYRIN